ncbi:MAG: hypothetical protein ABUK01_09800 [Leptospirales bacterium]
MFVKTSELLRNQVTLYRQIREIASQGNKNKEDIETIFAAIEESTPHKEESSNRKIGFDQP